MPSATKNNLNTNFATGSITLQSNDIKIAKEGNNLVFYDLLNVTGKTLDSLTGSGNQFVDGSNKLKTSSSLSFDGSNSYADSYGSDVYFYVSGTKGLTTSAGKNAVFGGDVRVSGSLTVGTGSVTVTSNDIQFGTVAARIERNGNDLKFYDISNPSGQSLSALATSPNTSPTWIDGTNKLKVTASVSIDGSNAYADAYGSDTYFYISGTVGLSGSTARKSVFVGDVIVSGSLTIGTGSITLTSNDIQFGDSGTKLEKLSSGLSFKDSYVAEGVPLKKLAQRQLATITTSYSHVTSSNEWTIPNNNAFVGMPALTGTISTSGDPVLVLVNANYEANSTNATAYFSLARNGTNIGHSTKGMQAAGPMVNSYNMNTSIAYLDRPAAGTHSYSYLASSSQGTGKIGASGIGPTTLTLIELSGMNVVTGSMAAEYSIPGLSTYSAVPGLTASIVPVKGPVLLLSSLNYQCTTAGHWEATSFFKNGVNLVNGAGAPNSFTVNVSSVTGERMGQMLTYLDTSPTLGGTNTYTAQAYNGSGTGKINEGGMVSQIIALELPGNNWKFNKYDSLTTLTTNTDYASVGNAQITTLSTSGKPVLILSNVSTDTGGTTTRQYVTLQKNGTNVVTASKGIQLTDGEGNSGYNKSATFYWLDEAAEGIYTYKAVGTTLSGTSGRANEGSQGNLFVWELDGVKQNLGEWASLYGKTKTTSSVAIDSRDYFTQDIGSDVYFYVSGTVGLSGSASGKMSVFGGDVRISGSLTIGTGSITLTSNDIQFGDSSTRIEKSGSNIVFYDAASPAGKTLSTLTSGSGGGGSTIFTTYPSLPAAGTSGRRAFVEDGFHELIDDSVNWRPNLGGVLGFLPPTSSSFTAYGTKTLWEDYSGSLHATKNSSGVSIEMFIATQAVTGSNFWVEVSVICQNAHTASSIPAAGIILRESGTGKFGSLYFYKNAANVPIFGTGVWTSPTVRASSIDYGNIPFKQDPLFFRARYDGTNVIYQFSHNRVYWKTIQTTAKASIFTTAPNEVGICVLAYNVDADVFFPHYFVG